MGMNKEKNLGPLKYGKNIIFAQLTKCQEMACIKKAHLCLVVFWLISLYGGFVLISSSFFRLSPKNGIASGKNKKKLRKNAFLFNWTDKLLSSTTVVVSHITIIMSTGYIDGSTVLLTTRLLR